MKRALLGFLLTLVLAAAGLAGLLAWRTLAGGTAPTMDTSCGNHDTDAGPKAEAGKQPAGCSGCQ